jgi:quercetin dioxygenase-like cupin family protein
MHHPPEAGPPLHVHKFEDEGFYILEGRYRFTLFTPEKQVTEAGPGNFVMAVRGVSHSFRSLGPGIGKMLVYFAPGGAEGYFEAGSQISPDDPDRRTKREELDRKYGIALVPRD